MCLSVIREEMARVGVKVVPREMEEYEASIGRELIKGQRQRVNERE